MLRDRVVDEHERAREVGGVALRERSRGVEPHRLRERARHDDARRGVGLVGPLAVERIARVRLAERNETERNGAEQNETKRRRQRRGMSFSSHPDVRRRGLRRASEQKENYNDTDGAR